MEEAKRVPLKSKIFYGIGDLYGGGAFLIIGTLFMFFLMDVAGFDPVLAGLIVMLGKVWDAVTDPAMGYISDHTRSRFGRRRHYLILGFIPVGISFMLMWLTVNFDSTALKFAYYLFTYVLFNTVFTMVMVPYNSLPAEMSSDYKERSNIIGIRMAFSQFSALLGALLPMTIVRMFDNQSTGFVVMGIVFGILYALSILTVFFGTESKSTMDMPMERQDNFLSTLGDLMREMFSTFKNKSLRVHITMYLCAYVAMDLFMALIIYYMRDYLHKEQYFQIVQGSVLLVQVISLILVSWSCKRFGNATTYRRHAVIWLTGIAAFGFVGPSSPTWILFVLGGVVGMGLAGGVMIPYNMLAFVVDADEMITAKRREGTYAGMMTFIRKLAQALALQSIGIYLRLIGYQAGTVVSPETVMGIRVFFVTAPALLIVIGAVVSMRFKITPKNHSVLMSEIGRLRQGGHKAHVVQETQAVVEEITGLSYHELWAEGV